MTFDLWPLKSDQFICESQWMSEPNLEKFSPCVLEISRSQQWHGRTASSLQPLGGPSVTNINNWIQKYNIKSNIRVYLQLFYYILIFLYMFDWQLVEEAVVHSAVMKESIRLHYGTCRLRWICNLHVSRFTGSLTPDPRYDPTESEFSSAHVRYLWCEYQALLTPSPDPEPQNLNPELQLH